MTSSSVAPSPALEVPIISTLKASLEKPVNYTVEAFLRAAGDNDVPALEKYLAEGRVHVDSTGHVRCLSRVAVHRNMKDSARSSIGHTTKVTNFCALLSVVCSSFIVMHVCYP